MEPEMAKAAKADAGDVVSSSKQIWTGYFALLFSLRQPGPERVVGYPEAGPNNDVEAYRCGVISVAIRGRL